MPELPEVETVRNMLKLHILDKKITDIEIRHNNIIKGNIDDFKKNIINTKIIDIQRKGKYLIFVLDNDYTFTSHLRMEGKYHYDMRQHDKHTHIVFNFEDETNLAYHDVRKFGKMDYFDLNTDIYNVKP